MLLCYSSLFLIQPGLFKTIAILYWFVNVCFKKKHQLDIYDSQWNWILLQVCPIMVSALALHSPAVAQEPGKARLVKKGVAGLSGARRLAVKDQVGLADLASGGWPVWRASCVHVCVRVAGASPGTATRIGLEGPMLMTNVS